MGLEPLRAGGREVEVHVDRVTEVIAEPGAQRGNGGPAPVQAVQHHRVAVGIGLADRNNVRYAVRPRGTSVCTDLPPSVLTRLTSFAVALPVARMTSTSWTLASLAAQAGSGRFTWSGFFSQ